MADGLQSAGITTQASWTPESNRDPTDEELLEYYTQSSLEGVAPEDLPLVIDQPYEAPEEPVPEAALWDPVSGTEPTDAQLLAFSGYQEPVPEAEAPIPLTPEEKLRQTPGILGLPIPGEQVLGAERPVPVTPEPVEIIPEEVTAPIEQWDPETGLEPTDEQLRLWSGMDPEDVGINTGIANNPTAINPVNLPAPGENADVGRMRSWAGSFAQEAGRLLSSIPKAVQLWFAPDGDFLDWMDEMDRIDTIEDPKERKAAKSDHETQGMVRWGAPVHINTGMLLNQYIERPKLNEGVRLIENRKQARARYLDQMRKTIDRPLYRAGEVMDEVVRDAMPVNPEHQEEFMTKVFGGLGSVVGYMTVFATTRRPTQAVTKRLGGGKGVTLAGQTAATAGVGITTQQAFAFEGALREGADIDVAFDAMYSGYTMAAGASEAVPILNFMRRADKMTGGQITKALKRAAIQGTEEAAQEVFQSIMENLTAQDLYDPERQLWGGTGEAGSIGFTTGAIVELLGSLLPGRRRAMAERAAPDETSLENQLNAARGEVEAVGGDVLDQAEAASAVMVDQAPDIAATKQRILEEREARELKAEAGEGIPLMPLAELSQAEARLSGLTFDQRAEAVAIAVAEEVAIAKERAFMERETAAEEQVEVERQEAEVQRAEQETAAEEKVTEAVEAQEVAPITIGEAIEPETREGLERMQAALAEEAAPEVAEEKAAPEVAEEPEAPVAEEPGRDYPLAPRGEWYADADYEARGGTLTEVTPDEFLAQATPLEIDETARENIDDLKRHMEEGRTLDPVTLYGAAEEGARASDGRHRAIAAKELGMKTIPMLDLRGPAAPTVGKDITTQRAFPFEEAVPGIPVAEEPALPGERTTAETNALIKSKAEAAATSPTNALPEPTEAQKEAGNYPMGHLTSEDVGIPGIDVTIENPKGSVREGRGWKQTMRDHYGYIKRTESAEGPEEQLDVFIGEKLDSPMVFVVDQVNQNTGEFDEHKVMVGYANQMDAVRGYKRNYSKGWKVGPVTAMTKEQFTGWLDRGDQTKPVDQGMREALPVTAAAPFEEAVAAAGAKRGRAPVVRFRVEEGVPEVAKTSTGSILAGVMPGFVADVAARTRLREETTVEEAVAEAEIAEDLTASEVAPISARDARAAVRPVVRDLVRLKPIVLDKPSSAPVEVYRAIRARGALRAKGVFYDGKLYVFANNHTDTADVVRTVLHEGVAHYGLRAVYKNEAELDALLDEVYASMTDEDIDVMRGRSRAYANIDLTTEAGQRELAEEHIAHLAETDPQQNFIQRVVSTVRQMLRGAGIDLQYTNDDIVAMLRDVRRELRKTVPLNRINVISEVEVAETGEVIEVEERADIALRQLTKRLGVIQTLRGCTA